MAYRFELTAQARDEADEVYHWISESSPERAARWYEGLILSIESLMKFPRRCPVAPESAEFGEEVRVLLYGK